MITATPFPMETPPRVLIELESDTGEVFESIRLYRDNQLVRTQPSTGGLTASAVDYFMAVQKETVYRAVTDQGVFTTTVLMASPNALLIHASQPTFTVEVGKDRTSTTTFLAIGDVTSSSAATLHRPIGSAVSIAKRSGPRPLGSRAVLLQTFTADQAIALDRILADDTPILFRMPGSWQVRFTDGWYQVTGYNEALPFDMPAEYYREWSLTLEPVAEPKLIVNEIWSWEALRDSGETWESLPLVWDTWVDLRINNRSA